MDTENDLITRRSFIAKTATYTGGLVIAFHIPKFMRSEAFAAGSPIKVDYPPNAFIRIAPDNSITLTINRLEMGQGVNTAFAQLLAEELGCDWEKIECVQSNADQVYNTPGMPFIITGGSMSVRTSWEQYRTIGAGMREMLKAAAAKRWNVAVGEIKVENGFLIHGDEKLSFGDVAEDAAKIPFPKEPQLKKPKDYKVIGKSLKRVDADGKSTGKAIFGQDVRIPGMLYAMIAKPPFEGSKLVSIDESAAKKVSGVVDVVKFADRAAVLATNTHAAHMGQQALNAQWDSGANNNASTAEFMKRFKAAANQPGVLAEQRGSPDESMARAEKHLTLEYEFPFLAHAPMEPLNTTINYDGNSVEMWAGFQMPQMDVKTASDILGVPMDKVKINVTYAGGSFGRRASKASDYTREACQLAKVVKKPIKVVYSREDDMRGGYYRPMTYHQVKLGLDKKGQLAAWDHFIVGQSIMKGTFMEAMMLKGGVDDTVVEGVKGTKYEIPAFKLQQTLADTPVTTLWWRSVGSTHTAYVMETAIDELAVAGGHDPLEYRLKLLKKSSKHVAVLHLLKKQTGWGHKKPPEGRAWGLAIHESFQSVVGMVVEVSMENNVPRVHEVWASAHVGQVVNPDGVATQIEGGVVFGLSAIMNLEIEIKDGKVVQGNFDQYPVLRMQDSPRVHVELVKTDEHPTGIGEPGVPPVGPALANAVFRLTGKRVRVLPFSKGLKV
jgi:isoquinoline 1-oxidoreductase beta subunit